MWSSPNAVPQVATAVGTPGQMARHHVGVALDDNRLLGAGDVSLGQIHAVQQVRLLEDRCLRRVQVLGSMPVVLEQPTRAKPHGITGDVSDRPQQPADESVDQALPTVTGQSGRAQLVIGEAAPAQM